MRRLVNKVCVVVGAGTVGPPGGLGIGKACAMALCREGAQVFAIDKNFDAARDTSEEVCAGGGSCLPFAADATNSAQVEQAIDECLRRFSRVDALVHSVGAVTQGGLLDCGEDAWNDGIAVNLSAAFLTSRAVVPSMLRNANGGSLVFVSSISATCMNRSQIAYASGKAGVLALSKSIGTEFASKGIRSNCILPGLIDTPLVEHTILAHHSKHRALSPRAKEAWFAERHRKSPTGKMGTAWDVADAAVYLASDESRYVNCAELTVDGGLSAGLG